MWHKTTRTKRRHFFEDNGRFLGVSRVLESGPRYDAPLLRGRGGRGILGVALELGVGLVVVDHSMRRRLGQAHGAAGGAVLGLWGLP